MTCREKLMLEYPGMIGTQYQGGCCGCPSMRGYLEDPPKEWCRKVRCYECWDREIPETEETDISNNEKENETMSVTVPVSKMTKAQMVEEIEFAHKHIVEMERKLEDLRKYEKYKDCADEIKAIHTALMDSGFTNDQAFDLLKTTMQSMMPTVLRGMKL